VQVELLLEENVPAPHSTHVVLPSTEDFQPGGQSVQVELPIVFWNLPAEHSTHVVDVVDCLW